MNGITGDPTVIKVDSRTGSRELLRLFPLGTAEEATLEFGDFAFLGNGPDGVLYNIGVERKVVSDFISSMRTGRLQSYQIPGMLNMYNEIYLIIEGTPSVDPRDGTMSQRKGNIYHDIVYNNYPVSAAEYFGYIASISSVFGIHILTLPSKVDTVAAILSLRNFWKKPFETHRCHKTPYIPHLKYGASVAEKVASVLPGIGMKRAHDAANHFKSIHNMINSTVEDWTAIDGIGDVTAERVVDAFKQEDV